MNEYEWLSLTALEVVKRRPIDLDSSDFGATRFDCASASLREAPSASTTISVSFRGAAAGVSREMKCIGGTLGNPWDGEARN